MTWIRTPGNRGISHVTRTAAISAQYWRIYCNGAGRQPTSTLRRVSESLAVVRLIGPTSCGRIPLGGLFSSIIDAAVRGIPAFVIDTTPTLWYNTFEWSIWGGKSYERDPSDELRDAPLPFWSRDEVAIRSSVAVLLEASRLLASHGEVRRVFAGRSYRPHRLFRLGIFAFVRYPTPVTIPDSLAR